MPFESRAAYAQSGFYAFPSDKPETSGVNLIKAQAMGAIPVTSRQPNSSFPEVCGRYDLGPPVPEGAVNIQSDPAWFQQWVDAMVHAASTPRVVRPWSVPRLLTPGK